MDKDTRDRGLIKLAYDEKQEQLEPQHVDVAGLTEYGTCANYLNTQYSDLSQIY